jgi:uncharacterized protein YbjT (DUF2867 family)
MTLSKPTILVLGATGKVGNQTARLLAQRSDVKIVAGVRSLEKAQHLRDRNIEIRHLDLDRHNTLVPVLEGIDRHAGKIYPLGYDAATLQDIAQILTDAVGKPFQLEKNLIIKVHSRRCGTVCH